MPAAAVIPAPIAYVNIVAVKKLVVGFLAGEAVLGARGVTLSRLPAPSFLVPPFSVSVPLFTGRGWAVVY